jgi:SAM-dependent methyltransferase
MKLLNIGCGGHRPQDDYWWNLDTLRTQLKEGTPERTNLDTEPRYVECDVLSDDIPFAPGTFDGILLQHVLEHMACHDAAMVIEECRKVLKTGGVLVASVPDVDYFRKWHSDDIRDNAEKIFGESISGDWQDSQCNSFFDYALWHREHIQILNKNGLWALLRKGGFESNKISDGIWDKVPDELKRQLNRPKFSAILAAFK